MLLMLYIKIVITIRTYLVRDWSHSENIQREHPVAASCFK